MSKQVLLWTMPQHALESLFARASNGGTVDFPRYLHARVDDVAILIRGVNSAPKVTQTMIHTVGHVVVIGDFHERGQLPRIEDGGNCATIDELKNEGEVGDAVTEDADFVGEGFFHARRE